MNSRQKGDYSELVVLAELASREKRVAIPYGNSEGFDLLVLSRKGWRTIQVKTAQKVGGRIRVDTVRGVSGGGRRRQGYEAGSFDFIIAVLPDERMFWIIDIIEMYGKRSIYFRPNRQAHWELLD